MGLIDLASANSVWRGYDYYEYKKVDDYSKLSENEYEGIISGSDNRKYDVFIDIEHPRKSKCNCPHAKDKRIICKHMIALYFTIFPKEAEKLIEDSKKYEKEEEERLDKLYEDTHKYINSLSKKELAIQLEYILNIAPDWVYDRFVRDNNIGYL